VTTSDTNVPAAPRHGDRPTPESVTTARTYVEVLGVFAAFFMVSVVAALLALAGRYNPGSTEASWAEFGPAALEDLIRAGLAVAVVVLVAGRRRLSRHDLGLAFRRNERGRVRVFAELRVAAIALLAFIVGGVVTVLSHGHALPGDPPSAASLVYECAHSFEAGVMEEVVVLAFVVAMLRNARRPTREIWAVAVLLRMSYHLYYGTGVLGIAVWAAIFVWLFWRTRSLLPLIIVHVWWDTVLTLDQRWPAVGAVNGVFLLLLFTVAALSWLIERVRASRSKVPSVLPGWYPDPAGGDGLRWWDGNVWHPTAVVRPAPPVAAPAAWVPVTASGSQRTY
jgi:hypothetical protein